MDKTIKVTSIHLIFGIITAFLSYIFTIGLLGFKNDLFSGILPFIILYFVGQLSQRRYGDEISGFSQWLWDGIAPFLLIWIITFTLMYNYIQF